MLQRVLILGAQGMLGQALQRTKPETVELLAWDRPECDLIYAQEVMQKIPPTRAQWIINCAAYNAVDQAEQEFDQALLVNATAVKYVAEAARSMNSRLIHISSDYVFDGTNKEGYRESDPPNPISRYGQSKLGGEQEALKASGVIVVRTSRLFGKPGQGKKSFVDLIVEKTQTQNRIEVIDGEVSSPTFVEDLAKELWKMATHAPMEAGIYHRTNDGACSWYELAKEILEIKKIDCELVPVDAEFYQRPAARPTYSQLKSTKLPALRSWQEALREYINSF